MRRIALLLEYDGAAYAGSQAQANAPSIQGALEGAIRRLTGEMVRVAFAGRTDAGVHARGQVAAFSTMSHHSVATMVRALNALLPEDIAVRGATEAPDGFDPRREARRRRYRYGIWNGTVRSPLSRRQRWQIPMPLDERRMDEAAAALVGVHDMASFGGVLPAGRSTWREVFLATVRRTGDALDFEIEATAFLPHQVRRIVGALVEIGCGRLPAVTFANWLAQPCAGVAGPTAPAHGLCLERVTYDNLEFTP